ncbi:hypothetical protein M3205_23280 [Cytobacillus firmus]|uniref:hypothetical protein n=1 Tax=Cytobacillus firmus TaxID=1399 RepID=UPI00203E166A|nr:hypothetical protein [Cytobacillus firmus]MCM3708569.1 hypothetical protein [Cytobacillus firmus]
MFISHVTSKGKQYIYLYEYCSSETKKKQSLYGFGRKEEAIKDMRSWGRNFNLFPQQLVEFGCTKEDLSDWIRTMETGVTKTGKKFKAII